jgi:hypothetical protein
MKSLQFQMLAWQNWVQWSFEKMGVSCCNPTGDNAVDSSDPQPVR